MTKKIDIDSLVRLMDRCFGSDTEMQRALKLHEESGELLDAVHQLELVKSGRSMVEMTDMEAEEHAREEMSDVWATTIYSATVMARREGKSIQDFLFELTATAFDKIYNRQTDPDYKRRK